MSMGTNPGAPPDGWTSLEFAQEQARKALAAWDSRESLGLYLHRAMALAETMRKLLAELDADHAIRSTR